MSLIITAIISAIAGLTLAFYLVARDKNMLQWLPGYIAQRRACKAAPTDATTHIMFCFVDHYEPMWKNADNIDLERERVDRWMRDYPTMAAEFSDADGRHPTHSFFFPAEEYRHEHLEKLAGLCAQGYAEIEIHLHHDNDTSENLRQDLSDFANTLHTAHGALPRDPHTGELKYAFIHGNWCLDNSRPDGRWCGVNDEISILRDTGCYADLTFPAAPDPSQPPIVNAIYYATDDPAKAASHFEGQPVAVGGSQSGDLLLINGPLMLNWTRRKLGLFPRIENSDIRANNPPTEARVDLWVKAGIQVQGRPEWRFIKVHTHGAQDTDMPALLGEPVRRMHRHLGTRYNDGQRFKLHYVAAREMYNIVKAAEAGKDGDPNDYRDFLLPRPSFKAASDSEGAS
jgi:hypothetical protein